MSSKEEIRDVVRSSDRHTMSCAVKLKPADSMGASVHFANGVRDSEGWVDAKLIDLSEGGLGVHSDQFIPRGGQFRIRSELNSGASGTVTLDAHARVCRLAMIDQTPRYEIGMAFVDLSDVMKGRVRTYLAGGQSDA